MKEKKVSGFDYLWCALYASAGFALELLLVLIENNMGIGIDGYTTAQNIVHFLITTALWVAAGFVVIFIGKKTTGLEILAIKEKLKGWQYFAIVICFVVNIFAKYLDWGGFKPLLEFNRLGLPVFIFQYIYYAAEGFLISLVIVYAQKACETWFKNEKIPYGGIILGLTWGIAHIVSKGDVLIAIFSCLSAFLFGAAYVFVNKDYRKALPIIILLFML
jgi:hypothetical protein